jgi:hypothetical protein
MWAVCVGDELSRCRGVLLVKMSVKAKASAGQMKSRSEPGKCGIAQRFSIPCNLMGSELQSMDSSGECRFERILDALMDKRFVKK